MGRVWHHVESIGQKANHVNSSVNLTHYSVRYIVWSWISSYSYFGNFWTNRNIVPQNDKDILTIPFQFNNNFGKYLYPDRNTLKLLNLATPVSCAASYVDWTNWRSQSQRMTGRVYGWPMLFPPRGVLKSWKKINVTRTAVSLLNRNKRGTVWGDDKLVKRDDMYSSIWTQYCSVIGRSLKFIISTLNSRQGQVQ